MNFQFNHDECPQMHWHVFIVLIGMMNVFIKFTAFFIKDSRYVADNNSSINFNKLLQKKN